MCMRKLHTVECGYGRMYTYNHMAVTNIFCIIHNYYHNYHCQLRMQLLYIATQVRCDIVTYVRMYTQIQRHMLNSASSYVANYVAILYCLNFLRTTNFVNFVVFEAPMYVENNILENQPNQPTTYIRIHVYLCMHINSCITQHVVYIKNYQQFMCYIIIKSSVAAYLITNNDCAPRWRKQAGCHYL